jgi:hypothetical protein
MEFLSSIDPCQKRPSKCQKRPTTPYLWARASWSSCRGPSCSSPPEDHEIGLVQLILLTTTDYCLSSTTLLRSTSSSSFSSGSVPSLSSSCGSPLRTYKCVCVCVCVCACVCVCVYVCVYIHIHVLQRQPFAYLSEGRRVSKETY